MQAPGTDTGEVRVIQKVAGGDADAFAVLFERYHEAVFNYATWLASDPELGQDIAQETFIRAHHSLHRLGPPFRIRAWLYRMARNLFIDQTRSRSSSESLDPDSEVGDSEADPERSLAAAEFSNPVGQALRRLSPQQ